MHAHLRSCAGTHVRMHAHTNAYTHTHIIPQCLSETLNASKSTYSVLTPFFFLYTATLSTPSFRPARPALRKMTPALTDHYSKNPDCCEWCDYYLTDCPELCGHHGTDCSASCDHELIDHDGKRFPCRLSGRFSGDCRSLVRIYLRMIG